MNSRSGRSQNIRHDYMKIYGLTAALCVVVALAVTVTALQLGGFSGGKPDVSDPFSGNSSPSFQTGSPQSSETGDTPSSDLPPAAIDYIECGQAELEAVNPLLIVDAAHPFDPKNAKDLVTIKTTEPPADGEKPAVYTWSNQLNAAALTALQRLQKEMITNFGEESRLFVNISYTSLLTDDQGGLNIGLAAAKCSDRNCTEPGHSDHATGYALDMRYNDGKYLSDVSKNEQTAFLQSHCASYGFVQSWILKGNVVAPGKVQNDSWHFRYVGVPHALYMTVNSLTFDAYMEALRATNFNKRLTVVSPDNSMSYEIYFIAADASGATRVPVPAGSNYTISGNGVDGFIVTVSIPG